MALVTDVTSANNLARKYRKKLRQIENLERLNRALSEEEILKISSKSAIREQLRNVLELLESEALFSGTRNDSSLDESSSNLSQKREEPLRGITGQHDNSSPVHVEIVAGEPGHSKNSQSKDSVNVPADKGTSVKYEAGDRGEAPTKAAQKQAELPKSPKKGKSGKTGTSHLSKRKCRVIAMDGHSDIITSVVVVDGRAVTASRDTTLKSWDLTTGDELRTFGGHTESVTCVLALPSSCGQLFDSSFPADDHLIISSSFDCTFKMWSLNTGKLLKSVYTFNPLTGICYMPACEKLLTASEGGKMELWNIESGQNCFSLLAYEGSISCVVVSDKTVFSSSGETIKVHQLRDEGSLACVFVSDEVSSPSGRPLPLRHIRCMALTSQGVLCGDDGSNLKLLDWKKGQVSKFTNHSSSFSSADAAACHGSYLITSSYDLDEGHGYVNVRDSETLTYIATLDDVDTEKILSLDFCLGPGGDIVLVTGGLDLKLWHVQGPTSGSQTMSGEEDIISLEYRQALSVQATDSESDNDDDEEDDDDSDVGDSTDDDDGRARQRDADNQSGGLLSWCTVL